MSYISINDLFKYAVCPFKLTFNSKSVTAVYTMSDYYSLVMHEALLYSAKNNNISPKIIKNIQNSCWALLKNNIEDIDTSNYLQIHNRIHKNFITLFDSVSEIIATDYMSTIQIDNILLKISIKAIFLSKEKDLVFLFEYVESGYNFNPNSIPSIVAAYVSKVIAKQDFNYSKKPKTIIYKTNNGMSYLVETEKSITELKPIVYNLCYNIKSGKFYPINSSHNCNTCIYESTCEWK